MQTGLWPMERRCMEPVIEAKRTAFLKYKNNPSTRNLEALRKARGKAQQTARHCANNYWLKLSSSIQAASDTVSEEALNGIASLAVMEELDKGPYEEELSKAIDRLACGKAPGADGITPDIIQLGKPTLLPYLHDLLCLCWNEEAVPQDMCDAKIVTLYKNKGDRNDCNNYRGISLLSTVGKVFTRVALIRLQLLAERVHPESQCGFRAARSTVDDLSSTFDNCRRNAIAALASHTETGLQQLVDRLSYACKEFALTISIKKTHVMGQEVENTPSISIDNKTLDCVGTFTYLGSTVSSNLSLDAELSTRLAMAARVARLAKRVWTRT
ncbi:uncharacterized protein LOC119742800 [Patiria miniata]|uniref:Reverse transcriptase domain-containing protein n=1 Tax=Patiria miniata TaxID=46514 RepID=A0A914BF73_PATMI|nr:uncharacterized protein LOC119742800 [Patiria miniata]